MKHNHLPKRANQDEITLYCLMGEAVCMIQELESALSCAITIKKNSTATKAEADDFLNSQRRYTLGSAVRLAEKEKLFPLALQSDLNDFFQRRNWLVHHTMFENRDVLSSEAGKNQLFLKIKDIADDASNIQRAIEMDLISFCQSQGKDMSEVLAALEEHDKQG